VLSGGFGPLSIRKQIDGMSFAEIVDLARRQPVKIEVTGQGKRAT
jgi:hypothetical protein